MKCFKCENEAAGVCRFCGRGLCKEHTQFRLHIPSVYLDKNDDLHCLAVKGALFCGKCDPIPVPVKVSHLDIERAYKAKKPK
jgi:hypothetical protein